MRKNGDRLLICAIIQRAPGRSTDYRGQGCRQSEPVDCVPLFLARDHKPRSAFPASDSGPQNFSIYRVLICDVHPIRNYLGFLEAYDRPIADLALALREIILEEVHDASESVIDLSSLHRRDLVRFQRKNERHVLLHRRQCAAHQSRFSARLDPSRPESRARRRWQDHAPHPNSRVGAIWSGFLSVGASTRRSNSWAAAAAGDVPQADFKSSPVWVWGGQANAMQQKNKVAPIRCGVHCGVESTYGNDPGCDR